ncbi:zeta toxin family protein, partial [Rhodococcus sp. CX]|uniref:zeta toxin family protein n=1 Tax=Rhodococcus sp. CX TaxID=2789880 RepID=UPI0018CEE899
MKQPCAKTHALLDSWCAPGGVLDAGGVRASFRLYENDPGRRRSRAGIVDAYLAEQTGIDRGVYDDLLDTVLPDGRRLRPRELATLVHRESTQILDTVQQHCIEMGENIVIEGTFRWAGLGAQLLTELGGAGYTDLTIVDVEVTRDTAIHRAQHRWWTGRIDPDDELGGRFTPTSAITDLYPAGSARSICARNARAAFDDPLS